MRIFNKKHKKHFERVDRSFYEEMESVGLEKHAKQLFNYARHSIYFNVSRVDEDTIPIGKTKIGGRPDVDSSFKWPVVNEEYLSFVAQINLEEVNLYDKKQILPNKGMLYFFCNIDEKNWGFDEKEEGTYRIIYYDGDMKQLKRFNYPSQLIRKRDSIYPSGLVNLKNKWSLPSLDEEKLSSYRGFYDNYIEYISLENGLETYMLGYAKNIQGDVRFDCIAKESIEFKFLDDKEIKKMKQMKTQELDEWILLFQIDSISELNMMWKDMGILYFMIKKEDFKNKEFDKTRMILQCY